MRRALKDLYIVIWQIIGGWGLDLYFAAEKRGAWQMPDDITDADLERWERRGWIKGRDTRFDSDADLPF